MGSSSGYSAENRLELPTIGSIENAIADLNGDGKLDIIFSSDASGEGTESIIYWGDENNSYTQKTNLDTNNAWGVSAGQSSAYGKTVAESSSVPEPSLMILLGFGLIFLFKKVK